MGNCFSQHTLGERIFQHARRGEYHQLKAIIDHLQRLPEFQPNTASILNTVDADGNTPLHHACRGGHYQVAELLLQRGANPHIQNPRSDGGTPLHEAVNRHQEHIITLLLHYRATPFVENAKSFTPMDFACQTKNIELLRRFEAVAPWRGWLVLKAPVALGLGSEWKRRWVVICHRLPSPFASPQRRRTHVSLLCYKSTADTNPDCRVWLDGARACEVVSNPRALQRTSGRRPAQMELRLHRGHVAPSGCVAVGSARDGYALQFRPDEGGVRGCEELRVWAETVNMSGTPQPPPQPQLQPQFPVPLPSTSSSQTTTVDADAELARRLQSQEDEEFARRLSTSLSQEPSSLLPPFMGGVGVGGGGASASAIYPPPQFSPLPNFGGSSGATTNQVGTPATTPTPSASASRPTPPPNTTTTPATTTPATTTPAKPAATTPSQRVETDAQVCCVCCDHPASHGFAHGRSVHQNICGGCAGLFERAGRTDCPTCRQTAVIVRIFPQ